jgi:hypothetical protein
MALCLRTCDENLQSHGGFQWPRSGYVHCPDWSPEPVCGEGLHGLRDGQGNIELLSYELCDRVWMVVETPDGLIVDLGGKVKFPHCFVRFCGDRAGAIKYLADNGVDASKLPFHTVISGQNAVAVTGRLGLSVVGGGDNARATAGLEGVAIADTMGSAESGSLGVSIVRDKYGKASSGDYGASVVGVGGKAITGNDGVAIGRESATVVAGDDGLARGGRGSYAIAGRDGIAIVGRNGCAAAGLGGTLVIESIFGDRTAVRVDGSVIQPNTFYRADASGRGVVRVEDSRVDYSYTLGYTKTTRVLKFDHDAQDVKWEALPAVKI